MPEIIAIINQKGGVAKSTTTLALGAGLVARGYKVLCVDLDAQGNLTYTMGLDPSDPTVMDVLAGACPASEAIRGTAQGDLIPSSPALATADITLTATGKEYRLREALEPVKARYDYILIDTPPALGILTVNALTAAASAIIPAQADIYSLQGIGQLHGTLEAVRRYTNPALRVLGILLTRYNARSILSRDIAEMIQATAAQLNTRVFDAKIRESIAVKEAQTNRLSLFDYAPKATAAQDYDQLITELLGGN